MQYLILVGELAKKKITNAAIARLLGIHPNSVHNKLYGDSSFTVEEAIVIHDEYFLEMDFKELFQSREAE